MWINVIIQKKLLKSFNYVQINDWYQNELVFNSDTCMTELLPQVNPLNIPLVRNISEKHEMIHYPPTLWF